MDTPGSSMVTSGVRAACCGVDARFEGLRGVVSGPGDRCGADAKFGDGAGGARDGPLMEPSERRSSSRAKPND